MEEIFDTNLIDALEYAQKLDLAGEKDAAKIICHRVVKEKATHNGEDMLCLFYGNRVYDGLGDATTALTYIYIAACAAKVFDVASARGPADASNGWARKGSSCNNTAMRDALAWLQKKGRGVKKEDATHFESILKGITPAGGSTFDFAASVAGESLISIMRGLVNGTVAVTSSGRIQ